MKRTPPHLLAALLVLAGLSGLLFWPASQGEADPAAAYEYDLAPYRAVPAERILYAEGPAVALPLPDPRALALAPGGTLWVAGRTALVQLDRTGAVQARHALAEPATCLAVDAGGTVFLGTATAVRVLSSQGVLTGTWPVLNEDSRATAIAVAAGSVAVADYGNRVVLRYDRQGELLRRIGERDMAAGIPGLVLPSPFCDIAFAAPERLWVANTGRQQLELYSADGDLLSRWGTAGMGLEGFSGCCNPSHFARTAAGGFITAEKGLVRIKHYRPDGTLRGVVAPPAAFTPETVLRDLAVDSGGTVYVLDPARKAIRRFTLKHGEKTL